MTITVTLDDELLAALRDRSQEEGRPVEAVLADAVRRGLADAPPPQPEYRNGIRLFPRRPGTPPVTSELVRRLMDETE